MHSRAGQHFHTPLSEIIHRFRMAALLCFFSIVSFSQENKQNYEEVIIEGQAKRITQNTYFNTADIQRLQPQDVGQVLQFASGTTTRSYGGLGGMKTISIRGLGGEHTKLITNGLPFSNTQNSLIDFSLFQPDNITNIAIELTGDKHDLRPASAQVMGNSISIITFENTFEKKEGLQMRNTSTLGSYGQMENYTSIKASTPNTFIGGTLKYRTAHGKYPYQLQMGPIEYPGIRNNNALTEQMFSFGMGRKWRDTIHHKLFEAKLFLQFDDNQRELPGAVILYNDFSDETLHTQSIRGGTTVERRTKTHQWKAFVALNRNFVHYLDPSYFNAEGFIDHQYLNHSLSSGMNYSLKIHNHYINFAHETEYSNLSSNRTDLLNPSRVTSTSTIGYNYQFKKLYFTSKLYHQFLQDAHPVIAHRDIHQRINPFFQLKTTSKFSRLLEFSLWYRGSMRPASFNELYYSQIGNISLKPEESNQFNFGITLNKTHKNSSFGFSSNLYYNDVRNRILALPTQNMFVWSIQNIGHVEIKGIALQGRYNFALNDNTSLEFNGAYTFQEVLDVTPSLSPSFRHQLAYTPRTSSSHTVSFLYKKSAIHTTWFYYGERYSLNQNVVQNLLPPISLFDLHVSQRILVEKKHTFEITAGIRNLLDHQYHFIRNFVMPGRNYFITLKYALN